jgi:hypothetical protein
MKMLKELCQVWNKRYLTKIQAHRLVDFSQNNHKLGIALGFSDEDQLHCGIIYRRDDDLYILHLKWHNLLSKDNDLLPFTRYVYLKIDSLPDDRIESICAMCEVIYSRHNQRKIAYGIKYNYDTNFHDGLVNINHNVSSGLTCATFILAVFNSLEIRLLNIETWKPRRSDLLWHQKIIDALQESSRRGYVSAEHLRLVTNERGCARYRPEEVAAGVSKADFFADFRHSRLVGYYLVKRIKKYFPA